VSWRGKYKCPPKFGYNQRIVQDVASQKAISLTVSILVNGTGQGVDGSGGDDGGDDVDYADLILCEENRMLWTYEFY